MFLDACFMRYVSTPLDSQFWISNGEILEYGVLWHVFAEFAGFVISLKAVADIV